MIGGTMQTTGRKTWTGNGWEIVCGDCVDVLREMNDASADVVLTDPPYGVGLAYDEFDDTREAVRDLAERWLPEARRISPIVAFTPGAGNEWLYPEPTWVLGWASKAGQGLCRWGFQCRHPILVYGKCPYLKNRKGARPDTLFLTTTKASVSKDKHPCAKPLAVMEWLIERTDPFGTARVVDPFCGSGTTGVAAIKAGRTFVGIEQSEAYCELAAERLREAEG